MGHWLELGGKDLFILFGSMECTAKYPRSDTHCNSGFFVLQHCSLDGVIERVEGCCLFI